MFAEWWWAYGTRLDSLTVPFVIENNIEMAGRNGLYLMGCSDGWVGGTVFYFGLQTNVSHPEEGYKGKGAIFSRWYDDNEPRERRLADTRIPAAGWTESGDYEGNFVSVRGNYEWADGRYELHVKGAEIDGDGRWFEYWVNDTWIGSLRFPLDADGTAVMNPYCSSTIEVYGLVRIPPSAIPHWSVMGLPPIGGDIAADLRRICYPTNVEGFRNVMAQETETGVRLEVGLPHVAHNIENPCPP